MSQPNHPDQKTSRNAARGGSGRPVGQDTQLPNSNAPDEDEGLIAEANDAIEAMEQREMRRDSSYRTGGDDHNYGIDTDIDSNAPKDNETGNRRKGGSRGASDWH